MRRQPGPQIVVHHQVEASGANPAAFGRRPFWADLALPASVRGPVEQPPWFLHRFLPGTGWRLQGCPALVLAAQRGELGGDASGRVMAEPHDARACARVPG